MNVIIYMAVSANGLINNAKNATPWCNEEWLRYGQILARAGCLIVGKKTHAIMDAAGEYKRLGVRRVVVLSSSAITSDPMVTIAPSAREGLEQLEQEGFTEVVVGGGAQTNAAFLEIGCVSEIYLDIEPYLFGGGLPLISPSGDLDLTLELLGIERYAPNAVGLRYKVLPA
jgi:dihydrofolate reductase